MTSFYLYHLLTGPVSKYVTIGIRSSTYKFWGDTNIQCITSFKRRTDYFYLDQYAKNFQRKKLLRLALKGLDLQSGKGNYTMIWMLYVESRRNVGSLWCWEGFQSDWFPHMWKENGWKTGEFHIIKKSVWWAMEFVLYSLSIRNPQL